MSVRLLSFGLLALCCGCGPSGNTFDRGGPSGSRSWSGAKAGVPGLDSGHCHYVGKLLLVWAPEASGGGGGSTQGGQDGITGHGQVIFRNGKEAKFTFRMPDTKTGTADFEGKTYQLAEGRVFLLKPDRDRVVVKQVTKDLSGIDPSKADLAEIGRADPEIKGFFEK